MIETIQRILALQPHYTSKNTPRMQERGVLVCRNLRSEVSELSARLSQALGAFGDDLSIEASHGRGRKAEIPWLRFCSEDMSPRPNDGYCVVVYFSTDGSATHVAIGCGASKYEKGTLVPLEQAQLDAQTHWARRVIEDAHGSVAPFIDTADYGARGDMGQSLERATVISGRVPVDELDDDVMESLLVDAASLLRHVYQAQADGRHLSHADLHEHESHHASGKRRGRGGQIHLSPEQRKLIELRTMHLVGKYLTDRQYRVRDTSAKHPNDFLASRDGTEMKVEVKGTTSDELGPVSMTSNEVDLHRDEKADTALFIVYRIRLVGRNGHQCAEGGLVKAFTCRHFHQLRGASPSMPRQDHLPATGKPAASAGSRPALMCRTPNRSHTLPSTRAP